jgi:O-6-methylguanine DNA methyltransferase
MDGFAIYKSEFGYLRMEYEKGKIIYLKKVQGTPKENGEKTELTNEVFEQLTEYLAGRRKKFDFPYELRGTEFQKKAWAELEKIPYGQTRTYGQQAAAMGKPKASRSVGMANHCNPIIIVVPCHRVIGANGNLTGYGGGLPMKEALLKLEAENK